MRPNRWVFTVILAFVAGLAVLLFFVLEDGSSTPASEPAEPPEPPTSTPAPPDPDTATPTPSPTPPPTPTSAATPTSTPAATASSSPNPSPTTDPTTTPTRAATATATSSPPATANAATSTETTNGRPSRCATVAGRAARLIDDIEAAMIDYEGIWGLALIDLDCGSSVVVRPQHVQYPASAGKIVILTASLRAVQDGLLEFELIEENVELVLHHSLDKQTDEIAELLTPEQVGEVMARAGVSARWYPEWQWRWALFTPHELALFWASIVRGEQLDERWTAHLLQLASEVVLPEGKEAFPQEFGAEGYRYGQKAGYWTPEEEEEPDVFVSAGYVVPEDGSSMGFTFAFLLETWEEDILEPKRRAVFPLVRDFVVGEMER